MTTPDLVERLRGLIERLEKLEGPDRAVDLEILARVDQAGEWSEGDISYALGDVEGTTAPPAFTAYLDAAVALVERVLPGWTGIVDFGGPTKCTATLVGPLREIGEDFDGAPVEIRDDAGGEGSTPAIALLIATLKALSQEASK